MNPSDCRKTNKPVTEIEELLTSDQRRITPAQHQSFRESITPPTHRDFHAVDYEVAGDPAIDRAPETQGYGKIKRVLQLLDGIENERGIA